MNHHLPLSLRFAVCSTWYSLKYGRIPISPKTTGPRVPKSRGSRGDQTVLFCHFDYRSPIRTNSRVRTFLNVNFPLTSNHRGRRPNCSGQLIPALFIIIIFFLTLSPLALRGRARTVVFFGLTIIIILNFVRSKGNNGGYFVRFLVTSSSAVWEPFFSGSKSKLAEVID